MEFWHTPSVAAIDGESPIEALFKPGYHVQYPSRHSASLLHMPRARLLQQQLRLTCDGTYGQEEWTSLHFFYFEASFQRILHYANQSLQQSHNHHPPPLHRYDNGGSGWLALKPTLAPFEGKKAKTSPSPITKPSII